MQGKAACCIFFYSTRFKDTKVLHELHFMRSASLKAVSSQVLTFLCKFEDQPAANKTTTRSERCPVKNSNVVICYDKKNGQKRTCFDFIEFHAIALHIYQSSGT